MACEICTRACSSEFFDSINADSSDVEFQQIITVEQASRGLSAVAELLAKSILGK